jgi:hypothetical protein
LSVACPRGRTAQREKHFLERYKLSARNSNELRGGRRVQQMDDAFAIDDDG